MLPLRWLLAGFLCVAVVQQSPSAHPDQCSISSIPNYTAWLNGSLQILFNSSEHHPMHCSYVLFRDMTDTSIQVERLNSSDDEFVFPLPKVSKEYDNATMSVVAVNIWTEKQYRRDFTIHTVDNVSAITNLTHSSNCTHTTSCWDPPYSHGLPVTDYWYELRLDGKIVESGVTSDLCVVFNLTTLSANKPGYSLSVWARAPPGNGTVTNISIAAATTPNVSYSTDVAMVSQGAIFILVGEVNLSCSPSYPTDVTVSFSCVPGSLPSVRHVYIGTNGSTEEIRSDAVETGHIGCNVTVTTSNLSGKNISELFTFDSTDVQLLVTKPSELVTGAIDLWMKLARNSSLLEIVVNVTNSRGKLVYSTTTNRSLHQREVNLTTDVLPVDQYTVSVLSCYNKSLTLNKTVNITHSNYSTPSPSTTVPPSTNTAAPSPTRTPSAPTPTTIIIIASVVAVVAVVVIAIVVGIILYLKRHRKESFNPDNSAIDNAAPVQATPNVHVDDHVIVPSVGGVTMPRTITRGQVTSSLPPRAEHYHSVPQETTTPGSQQHLALQNSVPVYLPNAEMVTTQTSQFTTEESIVDSAEALIDRHTQPPSLPSLPSAVHSTPQHPAQETTTTADSEQPLLPATTKESLSSTYGTVKQTPEEKELSYRVTGEEETNSAIN